MSTNDPVKIAKELREKGEIGQGLTEFNSVRHGLVFAKKPGIEEVIDKCRKDFEDTKERLRKNSHDYEVGKCLE